jgi:hypothetical protein
MPRSGASIGVVVVAIGEICSPFEKDAKASLDKLIVVALEIIAAKLVDHDDDNQLRMIVIGGG